MESSPNNNPSSSAAGSLSPRAGSPGPVGRTGSPPWTQIVRGPESDGAPADISLPENPPDTGDNAGGSKKPAWNKKPSNVSNGAGDNTVVIGGAASWPALSESTKASPKPSPSDSVSPAPPTLQVAGLAASSSSSSPLSSPSQSSLTSQKPTTSNANQYPAFSNHGRPARQKSMKRGDGNVSVQANGGFSHQSTGEGLYVSSHNSSVKPSSSGGNESSGGRDNAQNHGNRESGQRSAGSGDHHHHQPRNSFRRNGGPHSRGDGNYGGRRSGGGDQDHGSNHDWNRSRSFNGRDANPPMQSRVGPRGFVRTPPVSAPFVHPVAGPGHIRPFIKPIGMPDMPMIYFPPGGMPFVAPVPPPVFFPPHDPQLLAKIVNQIDYYFSNENLIKDTYLRRNMDQNGWVPVTLIAGFKKVMQLTESIQLILEAVRSSTVVEAQGDKIRRRDDWMRWIMPASVQFPTTPSLQTPESPTAATLLADIQSVSLNERVPDVKAEVVMRSSPGNLSGSLSTSHESTATSGC